MSPDTVKRKLKNKESTFSSVSDIAMYKLLTGSKDQQQKQQRELNKNKNYMDREYGKSSQIYSSNDSRTDDKKLLPKRKEIKEKYKAQAQNKRHT